MKFKPVFSERYIRNTCENEQCSVLMGAIEKVRLQALIDQQKCVEDRPTDRLNGRLIGPLGKLVTMAL